MSNDKAPFSRDDPFLIRAQLSEEERLILESAKDYAQVCCLECRKRFVMKPLIGKS